MTAKNFDVPAWLMGLVAAAILSLVGFAWDSRNVVLDNRVAAQEAKSARQEDKLETLTVVLARMEAKLDALAERIVRIEQKVDAPRKSK